MTNGVFSEYEVQQMYIKDLSEQSGSYAEASCVGSSQEELDTKVVTKSCRGVVRKKRVRGAGTGRLTLKLHVPRAIYNKMYAMSHTSLTTGVYGYGEKSVHPELAITQKVMDEDGVVKLKAYPRCIVENGPNRPIENGAEEVAELDLELSLMPDDYGFCMYEALASEATAIADTWMTAFTSSMAQAAVGATGASSTVA